MNFVDEMLWGLVGRELFVALHFLFPPSNCIVLSLSCSPNRGKKLDETLVLHEFIREYGDLQDWITQQKQAASSEDYGNDYEHVLVSFLSNNLKTSTLYAVRL